MTNDQPKEGSVQLKEGEFYRTLDGQKVGPMRKDPKFTHIWDCREVFPDDGDYHWTDDGLAGGMAKKDCPDLIAEWRDDPASIRIEAIE